LSKCSSLGFSGRSNRSVPEEDDTGVEDLGVAEFEGEVALEAVEDARTVAEDGGAQREEEVVDQALCRGEWCEDAGPQESRMSFPSWFYSSWSFAGTSSPITVRSADGSSVREIATFVSCRTTFANARSGIAREVSG
jgi:hypothetical protein